MPDSKKDGAELTTPEEKHAAEAGGSKEGKEPLTEESFLKAMEEAGYKSFLDEYLNKRVQSESDKRVTQALKTHEEKLKAKLEDDKKKEKEKETMPPELKKVTELEEKLAKLADMVTEVVSTSKHEKLDAAKEAALKAAKLPLELKSYLNTEKEDEIKAQVKTLQEVFGKASEEKIKEHLAGVQRPLHSSGSTQEEVNRKVRDYVSSKQPFKKEGLAVDQIVKK